ncbi:hypothetical protein [Acaryochloris sp. IP29b_bin.137]|uniref:hypothetical protein n=1 Tax=Acaryochloris sp. IP29b_bin.137 TaxID=2969217 RepID=UPI002601868D|nr:hypothetical protein [Acaryochloris sp. IP29b_bin.137]
MNQQWQKSTFRILFWIFAEIVLNLLNLDTLSDYSEFLLEQQIYDNRPKMVIYQDFVMVSPIPFRSQLRFHRFQIAST